MKQLLSEMLWQIQAFGSRWRLFWFLKPTGVALLVWVAG
ncbi:hypothetical protein MES5069_480054 [Mesorhizobium escarrei]|uniref:ABC transporter permease n=1 Tax=Mesorhizobium escarrei TaxID=666018 RepID=A0ABM9E926_9HYPH|nr:hypothetical protein MES5069_480054 [Mesorhizobium escarrei]